MSAMSTPLRRIVDPVVAGGPAGVRIRTRIHPSADEAAALTAIGTVLGGLYRGELAGRVRLGRVDRQAQSAWRAQRKRALTAVSSSRWAGAITRAVEDQYQLGMRGLAAHVRDLGAAVEVLAARCGLRPGELAPVGGDECGRGGRVQRCRGYRSAAERFAKTRRLAVLRDRLATAQQALVAGCPSIVVGGKRWGATATTSVRPA
jgi:hypothetical protein